MFSIIGLITGLAGPLTQVASQIIALQSAKQKAASDEEHQKIDADLQEAHDRRAALIAEAGSRLNAIMRGLLAAPVVILLWKLLVFDKALGQWTDGHTDALGPDMWKVITAVIAFYFLYDMAARWRK